MTPTDKLLRPASASTAGGKIAVGKTPLARLYQVAELSRRGRLLQKLARHGRAVERDRSR